MLNREEYIEQEFMFRSFRERLDDGYSSQEILYTMKNELLNTTDLPKAVDFLLAEIRLSGQMSRAMTKMPHYFTAFQTFIVGEAEREAGRFDFRVALEILEREAKYRSETPTSQGTFFYQLEALSRNRLGFDYGLEAISLDPIFDATWQHWINVTLRHQIGIVELTDLVYVRSELYRRRREEKNARLDESDPFEEEDAAETPEDEPVDELFLRNGHATAAEEEDARNLVLFGEKEGRIALASRHRDPKLFFAALSRHLGYPAVPRQKKENNDRNVVPLLKRRIEIIETKMELLDEEMHGGINLERFYVKPDDKQTKPSDGQKR